ncbi:MAG TPA: dockerin type I domain-containing protein [Pirellulaceae bacterium]|jgi:hypothetical protein
MKNPDRKTPDRKKRARPPQARNPARNSVRFFEQLESRLAMAAIIDCFDCAPDPPHPWHNFNNAHDVDGDGEVSPTDALVIINYLNTTGSGPVPSTAAAGAPNLDTTADNQVAPDDVMAVLNQLHYLNLVDKISSFRETADREFLSHTPGNVTDLHPVLRGNASEMPSQSDGISYFDLPFLIQDVSRKVYDSRFAGGSWDDAERAVDELLSKVVDDRAPSVFGF